jgi:hypothetical protein
MPPKDAGVSALTKDQIATLRTWIAQGARYEEHWSFVPPTLPKFPLVSNPKWARNLIDTFILEKLDKAGLKPEPEADKDTLALRAAQTLTGLPPTPTELDDFRKDVKPAAYERYVDRLMAKPEYGEHQARYWLDAVRYGDTHGLQLDNERAIYPYRDWVINAFNNDLPFDQFAKWQLAGDLLPNPTTDQLVATGYVRMNLTTNEGGAIPEEFLARNTFDRVDTTSTAFLGLTVGCAKCHDHKYDPIKQDDYYGLYAYFDSTQDEPLDGNIALPPPVIQATTKQQERQLATIDKEMSVLKGDQDPFSVALYRRLAKKRNHIADQAPMTLIARELAAPRPTFILKRGQYDQKGAPVTRHIPPALGKMPQGLPNNRLGFAGWLTEPSNPLVARVFVNRLWQQHFGTGIVKTVEDFGNQGEWPQNQALLDYLAIKFVKNGWSVKKLNRLIVTSAAFRQSSRITPQKLSKDPENRLTSRGPRYRLDAEVIRDKALDVAGLLVEKIGGHGVKPYQPEGIWESSSDPASSTHVYVRDKGSDIYRRSLYLFWKRTSPPPVMVTLDAPLRDTCIVRRSSTDTPLQALTILNETAFLESSRMLALRVLGSSGTDGQRLDRLFDLTLGRRPRPAELKLLQASLARYRQSYRNNRPAAEQLLHVGDAPQSNSIPASEQATWMIVCSTLVNTDEFITQH